MKIARQLLTFSIAALALSACSASGDTGDETQTDTAPPATGSTAVAAELPEQIKERGVLIAAGSGAVAPLQFTEEGSEEIIGIVPDLTAEYAERLGVEAQIERATGGSVVPGVEAGRFDVALSIGDFAERRGTMDFVDILRGGTTLVVAKGNPHGVEGTDDLCGRSLAIVKGSIQQGQADEKNTECVEAGEEPIDIQAYDDSHAAALAVASDRAEAEWGDIAPSNVLINENPDQYELAGEPVWLAPYAVGIPNDQPELRDAIYTALTAMFEDGTYHDILEEWGQENLALDKIEINGSEF